MATWRPLFEHQTDLSDLFSSEGLVTLFSISSDALCGCDEDGNILVANKNFSVLCELSLPKILNANIKTLLVSPEGKPIGRGQLPFTHDGTKQKMMLRVPHSAQCLPVEVRALGVGEKKRVVLVAILSNESHQSKNDTSVEVAIHSLANATTPKTPQTGEQDQLPQSEGTNIDTLEAASYSGNERILSELVKAVGSGDPSGIYSVLSSELMGATDAEGAGVFLADAEGYHLKACKGILNKDNIPAYLSADDPLAELAMKHQSTVRYTRTGPKSRSLYSFLAESSSDKTTHKIVTSIAPPLSSFYIVPVIFDGTVVAFTIVGWQAKTTLSPQSARVLDLLSAHYADELVTASVSMQTNSSDEIQQTSEAMWVSLQNQQGTLIEPDIQKLFHKYANVFDAQYLAFYKNDENGECTAVLNEKDFHHIEFTLADMYRELIENEAYSKTNKREHPEEKIQEMLEAFEGTLSDVTVIPFGEGSILSSWTATVLGKPLAGAVFVIPEILGKRHTVAIGHFVGEEPLSHIEITLYKRFLQDACLFVRDKNRAAQDVYVSKILQAGLENQTQTVEGLTVVPLYNSATKATEIGGDFYDVIALPNHKACIIMGDVAGKGVGSAAISSAVRTALGAYAWEGLLPAHMVRSLNDFFLGFSRLETFATLFVGILDMKTGKLVYCSAGHPPAIVMRPKTGKLELLNKQSGVVGAFREIIYENGHATLEPGDQLLLYTDGAIEARKPATGEFFGELSLHDALMKHFDSPAEEIPEIILGELYAFSQNDLDDDVALMCLRFDAYAT